jgi:hypothetical protein
MAFRDLRQQILEEFQQHERVLADQLSIACARKRDQNRRWARANGKKWRAKYAAKRIQQKRYILCRHTKPGPSKYLCPDCRAAQNKKKRDERNW